MASRGGRLSALGMRSATTIWAPRRSILTKSSMQIWGLSGMLEAAAAVAKASEAGDSVWGGVLMSSGTGAQEAPTCAPGLGSVRSEVRGGAPGSVVLVEAGSVLTVLSSTNLEGVGLGMLLDSMSVMICASP